MEEGQQKQTMTEGTAGPEIIDEGFGESSPKSLPPPKSKPKPEETVGLGHAGPLSARSDGDDDDDSDYTYETSEDLYKKKMEEKRSKQGISSDRDIFNHASLYREASIRNWKFVREYVKKNPDSRFAPISNAFGTLIHVMASTKEPEAVKLLSDLLVDLVDPKSLEQTDINGMTTLHYAAASGNAEAAKILLSNNSELLNIKDDNNRAPLYYAARSGQADAVAVLLPKSGPTGGEDPIDIPLVNQLITTNLFGIALQLIMNCSQQRTLEENVLKVLFKRLATKDRAFRSGRQLGFWQEFVYKCAPIERKDFYPRKYEKRDEENHSEGSQNTEDRVGSTFLQNIFNGFGTVPRKVHVVIWKVIRQLAPSVRKIDEEILKHNQAYLLLKHLCEEFERSDHSYQEAINILKEPILKAATMGCHEFVDEVSRTYPDSFMFFDNENRNILQLAILHKREEVFVGIMEKSSQSEISILKDTSGKNVMYYAAELRHPAHVLSDALYHAEELRHPAHVPSDALYHVEELSLSAHVHSAALQMQKEIQWFKVLEDLVHPSLLEAKKYRGMTPWELFIMKHGQLMKEGQEWMKTTDSSCTVVAALITTMVFAAAFTVPGGVLENGTPLFLGHSSILTFLAADTLALISSSTSILMFLGILTSRYSAIDFMEYLPRKLMFGLITLFISIASMIIAFGAAIHIVLFRRFKWVDIPFSLIACFPVILFVWLQFPLLMDIYRSTYCSKICQLKRS